MSSGHAIMAALCAMAMAAAAPADQVPVSRDRPAAERPIGPMVDFAVVLADGTAVPDLQPAELEVRIDGRLRVVRSLRRVVAAPAVPTAASALPPPYGTNEGVAAGRSLVLLFDQESLAAGRETLIRDSVAGLLATLTPADQTMVVALPYGGIRQPFTSDRASIRRAVDSVSGQGNERESGSDMACRTRRFLESLDGFLIGLAGRAEPLTVVLFTAGLAAPRRDAPMALAPGMCELLVNHFESVSESAGAARVNFYVLHPVDIAMSASGWRESVSGREFLGSDNPVEGIEHLAGSTGSARLPLDAGTGSLLRVAIETSMYYMAELESERDERLGRSRPLSVRVTRRGVTVRARPVITFPKRPSGSGVGRKTIADLLSTQAAFTELPLRAGGFTVREAGGRLRVGVVIESADPGRVITTVGAVLVAGDGRIVARWFATDANERPIVGAMAVPPGTYRLRVAAIDAAGLAGAAEEAVEARLTPVGPLSLGSLILGVSREPGVTPRLEFHTEPTAIASFDIYGGDAGMRLSAALEVARELDGPPLANLPVALTRADEDRVVATGAVPIGALPPGDYVVRGIVRLEDGTVGRVSRTLRKVLPEASTGR